MVGGDPGRPPRLQGTPAALNWEGRLATGGPRRRRQLEVGNKSSKLEVGLYGHGLRGSELGCGKRVAGLEGVEA